MFLLFAVAYINGKGIKKDLNSVDWDQLEGLKTDENTEKGPRIQLA